MKLYLRWLIVALFLGLLSWMGTALDWQIPFSAVPVEATELTIKQRIEQGGLVELPSGEFVIEPGIVVPPNTTIISANTTLRVINGFTAASPKAILRITGTNIHLSGITLDGNKANTPNALIYGIYFLNASSSSARDFKVKDTSFMGVKVENSQWIELNSFEISGTPVDGLGIYGSDYVAASSGSVHDVGCYGISLTNSDFNDLRNITSLHNQVGLEVREGSDYNVFTKFNMLEAKDNKGDNSWWNIEFYQSSYNTMRDSLIVGWNVPQLEALIRLRHGSVGNTFDNVRMPGVSYSTYGYHLDYMGDGGNHGSKIINGYISNQAYRAIAGNANDTLVTGMTLEHNGRYTDGQPIKINGVNNLTEVGNIIK